MNELIRGPLTESAKAYFNDRGDRFPIYRNPSVQEFTGLTGRHERLRGMIDRQTGDLYVWPAAFATHDDAAALLGILPRNIDHRLNGPVDTETGSWVLRHHKPEGREEIQSLPRLQGFPLSVIDTDDAD